MARTHSFTGSREHNHYGIYNELGQEIIRAASLGDAVYLAGQFLSSSEIRDRRDGTRYDRKGAPLDGR